MQPTTTESSADVTAHLNEMIRRKNVRIGLMIIQLETTRKYLDRLRTEDVDKHELSNHIQAITDLVTECTH